MIIKLPRMIYMNTPLDRQIKLINSFYEGQTVSLSFENVEFIMPESTIILLAISKQIYLKTNEPVQWINMKDEIRTYVDRIQIKDLDFILLPKNNIFRIKKKSNSLVEMKIMKSHNQYEDMISETKRIMYEWFTGRYADQYVKQITEYVKDIAANSLEHSEQKGEGVCYFTLQKYSPQNSKTKIHVAFGDMGIGILNSLAPRYPWLLEEKQKAVECAFIKGLSCRGHENGGLGFRNVKKQLKQYGGEIQIRSGKEMLRYRGEGKYKVRKFEQGIIGTQTLLILE